MKSYSWNQNPIFIKLIVEIKVVTNLNQKVIVEVKDVTNLFKLENPFIIKILLLFPKLKKFWKFQPLAKILDPSPYWN